jgi:hypothetical protein
MVHRSAKALPTDGSACNRLTPKTGASTRFETDGACSMLLPVASGPRLHATGDI